jgi:hypothetical protein
MKRVFILRVTKVLALVFALGNVPAWGQVAPSQSGAVALYRELLNPSLDVKDVYQVREVSIMMEDLHISISDGTIAFVREVNGHITGAMFDGVGEVLLVPPNRAERTSLALFTGSAVLEQRFQSAYLRFADDKIANELKSGLRFRHVALPVRGKSLFQLFQSGRLGLFHVRPGDDLVIHAGDDFINNVIRAKGNCRQQQHRRKQNEFPGHIERPSSRRSFSGEASV